LRKAVDNLTAAGIRFQAWYEPDLNNELTAIATEPVCGEQRQHFKRFELLKTPKVEVCAVRHESKENEDERATQLSAN
jgi:hypothetical protein